MPRWLKFTAIGCGGLVGLFILLGILGAVIGGGETATEKPATEKSASQAKDSDASNSSALREENSSLLQENEELQGEVDSLRSDNDAIRAQAEDLQTKNGELQDQVEELEAKAAKQDAAAVPAEEAAPAGTKHVKVIVTSDIPVDVSIMDDNFDASISEEIQGEKTYEFDIAQDSGLLVDASNLDQSGNIHVQVYENGELVTEDTDAQYAQVMY